MNTILLTSYCCWVAFHVHNVFFTYTVKAVVQDTNEYVVGAAGNAPTTSESSTILLPCLLRCDLYYKFYSGHQNIYKWMQIVHSYCFSNHVSGLIHVILIISFVFDMSPGPRFNIKMPSYQYRKSHCGDKTILRPSYLHNGISYTGKMTSLYWVGALATTNFKMCHGDMPSDWFIAYMFGLKHGSQDWLIVVAAINTRLFNLYNGNPYASKMTSLY